ncbi:DUF1990 family protein [Kribbella sp. NPDC051770]|uniref:DUF1990 family protein n=1 Tax=Kribbella sp. NPDC051770 TaxID=3155413 RepID=UPI00341C8121
MSEVNYAPVGATGVGDAVWVGAPVGFRGFEGTVRVGEGEQVWGAAAEAVMRWGVKTRSGFGVEGAEVAVVGEDCVLVVGVGPVRVREPVRVVEVVETGDRCGFAYGTRVGHPVVGEEAFVVHRGRDGVVWLTIRSVTRAGRGWWRVVFPAVLVAQRVYRRRYLRAFEGLGVG